MVWRRTHQTAFALFWLMSLHAWYAGTDSRNPVLVAAGVAGGATVAYLTSVRLRAGLAVAQRDPDARAASTRARR